MDMQRYLIFLLFVLPVFACSQPADLAKAVVAVRSIDPADTDFSDLAGLRAAVGDARIVLLGEQTHGEGTTFQAKIRLIKFLHEKMGFDVLAFESGLYDCARIWENVEAGGRLPDEVGGSLFYMYATSVQMQDLFGYIQGELPSKQPLVLTGFDSQHTGEKAKTQLFDDFQRFLKKQFPDVVDPDFELFRRVTLAAFASKDYRPSVVEQERFTDKLNVLKKLLNSDESKVSDSLTLNASFWYQVVCSIESQTHRYWQLVHENEASVRDLQMARNLIWLAEKAYPGKKIIVWAHNVHVAKGLGAFGQKSSADDASAFVPMGYTIHHYFGSRAYCIGFSGGEGTYMNYVDSKIRDVPAPMGGSVEALLAATGVPYGFVDYHHAPKALRQSIPGAFVDFGPAKGEWPEVFDGLFFIDKVAPVQRFGN
jgi:erythromycin esterase